MLKIKPKPDKRGKITKLQKNFKKFNIKRKEGENLPKISENCTKSRQSYS